MTTNTPANCKKTYPILDNIGFMILDKMLLLEFGLLDSKGFVLDMANTNILLENFLHKTVQGKD